VPYIDGTPENTPEDNTHQNTRPHKNRPLHESNHYKNDNQYHSSSLLTPKEKHPSK